MNGFSLGNARVRAERMMPFLFGLLTFLSIAAYPEPKRWIFIAATAALALLDGIRRAYRSREMVLDLCDALLAGLIAFGALSLFWSANRNGGIQTIIIACALLVLIIYLKRFATAKVLTGISIGVGLSAIAALSVNMWLPANFFSGFANSGYAAEALLLCVPFVWPLWRFRTLLARGFVVAVAVAVIVYIVGWTPSMIGFFVVGIFAAITSLIYAFSRGWAFGALIASAWLTLPPLAAWVAWEPLRLTGRLMIRVELWVNTLLMWADRPLFGHGLGSFIETYPLYKEAHGDLMSFVNRAFESYITEAEAAHNEPLQLLAELGLVGFLPFLALMALVIWAGWRRLKADAVVAAGIVGLIAVLGESLLEYPFQRAATLFLAVLAFGFASRALKPRRFRMPKIAVQVATPVAIILSVGLIFVSVRQEEAETLLDASKTATVPVQAFALVYGAHQIDPLERRIRTALPVMLDGVFHSRGLAAIQPTAVDQVYAWQEDGGANNTAALVAHAQFLLERDNGDDLDFPRILARLKAGSDRVAARYAIEARYQIGHGQYAEGLETVAKGKTFNGLSGVAGADAAIQANLRALEEIARRGLTEK